MGISVKYCADNPAWAAQRIDELEAQLVSKFFAPIIGEAKMRTLTATTPLDIEHALAFVDALDYAHGYTRWVDTMKVLAFALRARVPEAAALEHDLGRAIANHAADLSAAPEEGTIAVKRGELEWLARQKLENDLGKDAYVAMEAVAFAQRYIKPGSMNLGEGRK